MWRSGIVGVLALVALATPLQAQEGATVPDSIAEAIKAHAAEEWPDDFAMQKFVVGEETAAYLWVETYEPPAGVPDDVIARIREKAAADWPDQYTMQKFVTEEQVEAYLELQ